MVLLAVAHYCRVACEKVQSEKLAMGTDFCLKGTKLARLSLFSLTLQPVRHYAAHALGFAD